VTRSLWRRNATDRQIGVTQTARPSHATSRMIWGDGVVAPGPSRLKDIIFENGSLTDATDGWDSTLGTPTLDTSSQIKGVNCMRCTAVGDFGREDFTASNTLYVSFCLKFTTLPASTQTRTLRLFQGSTTQLCGLRVVSTGKARLVDAANVQIGSDDTLVMTAGSIYRLGLRYTAGTGANGIIEAFSATGDNNFGAAFASTSVDASTTPANRIDLGQNASGTVCDVFFDDIRIDTAAMPGPSIASSDSAWHTLVVIVPSIHYAMEV
jgi:hypothetical protein